LCNNAVVLIGKGLTAAVVGGGIGGLAAAAALTRAGIEASVYEQAPEIGEIGAGVLIGPNSVRLLHRLGLAGAIDEVGGWVGEGSAYYRHDGTWVASVMTTDSAGWAAMYGMHRADLVDVLRRAVSDDRIHPGHRAASFEQGTVFEQGTGKARVTFENGAVAEADLVIAADGIHSAMRRFVTEPAAPVFSGQISYRGVLDTSRVPWWPARIFQVWMGEGKHVIVFPVRAGRMLNFVCFVPADKEMRESWSAPGDPDALRAAFEGFAAPVTGLLRQVDSTFWWGLNRRRPTAGCFALSTVFRDLSRSRYSRGCGQHRQGRPCAVAGSRGCHRLHPRRSRPGTGRDTTSSIPRDAARCRCCAAP
jgi:salicylate hydroxylase